VLPPAGLAVFVAVEQIFPVVRVPLLATDGLGPTASTKDVLDYFLGLHSLLDP
jgi:hypothetical protein